MGTMGILGNLTVKYNSKRIGETNLVVIGFLAYALADVLFGIISKSLYLLLFLPSTFTFFSIVTNTLLDSITSTCVSSNDQGLVMGSMSQCRALTSFFLRFLLVLVQSSMSLEQSIKRQIMRKTHIFLASRF